VNDINSANEAERFQETDPKSFCLFAVNASRAGRAIKCVLRIQF
jgi:hypothetical protein